MAYIQKDRVKETTTTNGTGAVTLAGAVAGFQAFSAVMSVADTCYYVIVSATGTDWETGTGTYSSASVLTRTTVLSSSNSGNAVSFTSGTKDVFMGPVAERVTDIAHGGTGATTAAGARTNLGVSTGTVTSVSGAGTVSGLTLTGTVTSSGSLTLGGAISTLNQNTTGNAATVTTNANLTGHVTSVGNAAVLGAFTSAQLAGALSDETGTGANVFATSPTLVTPLSNTLNAIPVVSGLTASVTAATGASGIITYTASNTFTVGRTVSVTGLGVSSGTTLNIAGMTIATASSSEFTVVNATVGVSSGTGTATAGGNTLAVSASNAVTAGPGGNYTITAGSGVGVGKGGDIILQPGAQGSSGGNGWLKFANAAGQGIMGAFNDAARGYGFGWDSNGNETLGTGLRSSNSVGSGYLTLRNQGSNLFSVNANTGCTGVAAPSAHSSWRFMLADGLDAEVQTGHWALSCSASNGVAFVRDGQSTVAGGSFAFPSTTTAIAANTDNLVLTGSAFQRLNCTAASSLTGIAPPSGGTHVDGRMIRVYNVGTFNLTLSHNVTSTVTNRFFNSTAADIILAPNRNCDLIYDSTDNGRGGAGWRVSDFR